MRTANKNSTSRRRTASLPTSEPEALPASIIAAEDVPPSPMPTRVTARARTLSASPVAPKVIDPRAAKALICGLQGSGKTEYAKHIIKHHGLRVLVFSPHYDDFAREPDNFYYYDGFAPEKIERFLAQAKALCKKGIIDGVLIDEFDMIFRSAFEIGPVATDIIANHRHYNMCVVAITRRPQDVPAYFVESCKFVVCFALQGDNARRKFNSLYSGFGDAVTTMEYTDHRFFVKEVGRVPTLHGAITL